MKSKKRRNIPQTKVCICVNDDNLAGSLRDSVRERIPSVRVSLLRSLTEIDASASGASFFLLFSVRQKEWRRGDFDGACKWLTDPRRIALALTDSAEPGFLRELYTAGVADYFLDTPAGHIAAVARLARESQKYTLNEPNSVVCPTGSGADWTLAERVRRATFRETVATINHQINNPLSEILATVEMLDTQENDADALRTKRLREIQQSAHRIQRVTMRLLDLVNPEPRQTPAGNMIDLSQDFTLPHKSRMTARELESDEAGADVPVTVSALE